MEKGTPSYGGPFLFRGSPQGLLAEWIDLLAAGHPAGIRVLLGEATPPSAVDLAELPEDGALDLGPGWTEAPRPPTWRSA